MVVETLKVPSKSTKKPAATKKAEPKAAKARPASHISPSASRPSRPLRWLTRGNTKMGRRLIYIWSMPAVSTCPGSTDLCRTLCYATNGHYRFGSLQQQYREKFAFSRTTAFVGEVSGEIARSGATVVRIHGAGDFYSNEYMAKWAEIVRAHRGVTFYAYTRSWALPDMAAGLEALAAEPNFHMWYSLDKETGVPARKPRRVRYAYMVVDDSEERLIPRGMDLVFRVREQAPKKWMGGALVCPYEQKVGRRVAMTCESCRICFKPSVRRRGPSSRRAAAGATA